jgi:hypothetical protein
MKTIILSGRIYEEKILNMTDILEPNTLNIHTLNEVTSINNVSRY